MKQLKTAAHTARHWIVGTKAPPLPNEKLKQLPWGPVAVTSNF